MLEVHIMQDFTWDKSILVEVGVRVFFNKLLTCENSAVNELDDVAVTIYTCIWEMCVF